jgi:hypothetical protein
MLTNVISVVLKAVIVRMIKVFWDLMTFSLVDTYLFTDLEDRQQWRSKDNMSDTYREFPSLNLSRI